MSRTPRTASPARRRRIAVVLTLCGALMATAGAAQTAFDYPDKNLSRRDKQFLEGVDPFEERLAMQGMVVRDAEMEAYLTDVAERVLPKGFRDNWADLHVRVYQTGAVNAFALPNGGIYFTAGIFPHLKTEDHLAFVMAHEAAHVAFRHGISSAKQRRSKTAFLGIVSSIAAGGATLWSVSASESEQTAIVLGHALAQAGLGVVYVATVQGYSRDLEEDADRFAVRMATDAGYNPQRFPEFFEILLALHPEENMPPTFLLDHPRTSKRLDYTRDLVAGLPPPPRDERLEARARYKTETWAIRRHAGALLIAEGQYDMAVDVLRDTCAERPDDSACAATYADALRAQAERDGVGKDLLLTEAESLYTQAIQLDPDNAAPHKGLGLVYLERGDRAAARRQLDRYHAEADTPFARMDARRALAALHDAGPPSVALPPNTLRSPATMLPVFTAIVQDGVYGQRLDASVTAAVRDILEDEVPAALVNRGFQMRPANITREYLTRNHDAARAFRKLNAGYEQFRRDRAERGKGQSLTGVRLGWYTQPFGDISGADTLVIARGYGMQATPSKTLLGFVANAFSAAPQLGSVLYLEVTMVDAESGTVVFDTAGGFRTGYSDRSRLQRAVAMILENEVAALQPTR